MIRIGQAARNIKIDSPFFIVTPPAPQRKATLVFLIQQLATGTDCVDKEGYVRGTSAQEEFLQLFESLVFSTLLAMCTLSLPRSCESTDI